MNKKRIALQIINLSNSPTQAGAYSLILKEINGTRQLSVLIGVFEAQAILIALKGIAPPRPLTHGLFVSCLEAVGVQLLRIIIYKVEKGVFYSYLYLKAEGSSICRIDARTSDAVALAQQLNAPILVYESILASEQLKTSDECSTDEELKEAIQEAVKEENYERAAQLRDILLQRKE